jgi:hypothetical protein
MSIRTDLRKLMSVDPLIAVSWLAQQGPGNLRMALWLFGKIGGQQARELIVRHLATARVLLDRHFERVHDATARQQKFKARRSIEWAAIRALYRARDFERISRITPFITHLNFRERLARMTRTDAATRIDQLLGNTAAERPAPAPSRMRWFCLVTPDRPRRGKTPSFIRAILERIRRAVARKNGHPQTAPR